MSALPIRDARRASSTASSSAAVETRDRAADPEGDRARGSASCVDVGLDYLTLDRGAATLSGGEGQRIRLATQIGSRLTGVLYVLDEPSIGLHQRDNARLLATLIALRDLGNTVVVVEHDRDMILAADHVIDMGPGAGVHGGRGRRDGHAGRDHGEPGVAHRPLPRGRACASRCRAQRRRGTGWTHRRPRRARQQPARASTCRSRSAR